MAEAGATDNLMSVSLMYPNLKEKFSTQLYSGKYIAELAGTGE